MFSISYIFPLLIIWKAHDAECASCSLCFEDDGRENPTLSTPEPVWTEPQCMDAAGGQKLVSVPIRYYRKDRIAASEKRQCLEKCAADLQCQGVEWYDFICYTIHPTYHVGATPTQGTIKFRSSKCFNLSANNSTLQRLKRHWDQGLYHMWNHNNAHGTELKENSGACLLPTAVEGCNLVPIGSNAINRQLFARAFDRFEGYCAMSYGECGATELLKGYYRTEPEDWHYTIGLFTENSQINNYRYLGDVCYFWPGYIDINCPMPEA